MNTLFQSQPKTNGLGGAANKLQGMQVLMQAFVAMKRGENPVTFMTNLAQTNKAFAGLDMSDLAATASSLAEKTGTDMNALAGQIGGFLNNK